MVGPTDNVAMTAAQLLHAGKARNIGEAIVQARGLLDELASPSFATVRKHLEAISQASIGMAAWQDDRLRRLEALEELLQTIAYLAGDCTIYVTGRSAEGRIDQTDSASIRVVGVDSPSMLMDALEAHGFPPMEVSSLATLLGSMTVAQVQDGMLDARLLFLPDVPAAHLAKRIADDRPVAIVGLEAFSEHIENFRSTTAP
jgi:hypothetical protein